MRQMMMLLTMLFALATPAFGQVRYADFMYLHASDAMTDEDRSMIGTRSLEVTKEGRSRRSGALLGWKCMADGLNVVYALDRFFLGGADGRVFGQFRFDKGEPSEFYSFELSTSHTLVFLPMHLVDEFTERAKKASRVVMRVVDVDGEVLTDTFSLMGLTAALRRLPCAN